MVSKCMRRAAGAGWCGWSIKDTRRGSSTTITSMLSMGKPLRYSRICFLFHMSRPKRIVVVRTLYNPQAHDICTRIRILFTYQLLEEIVSYYHTVGATVAGIHKHRLNMYLNHGETSFVSRKMLQTVCILSVHL